MDQTRTQSLKITIHTIVYDILVRDKSPMQILLMNFKATLENITMELAKVINKINILKECSDAIVGCGSCTLFGNRDSNTQKFVNCDTCEDGLYLLKMSSGVHLYYPTYITYCVPDCKAFGDRYVNDFITGTCQGCEKSFAWDLGTLYWTAYDTDAAAGEASFPNFVQSQQCDTSANCQKCSSTDLSACQSTFCGFSALATDPSCLYPFPSPGTKPNCLQYSGSNCQYCYEGFYLKGSGGGGGGCSSGDCCALDPTKNCKVIQPPYDDGTKCKICKLGYGAKSNGDCIVCDQQQWNEYCSFCAETTPCTACNPGYLSGTSCIFKCPAGKYPLMSFEPFRGHISSSTCTGIGCPINCVECLGSASNQCTKCSPGFYLSYDSGKSYGSCLAKTVPATPPYTDRLYVTGGQFILTSDVVPLDGGSAPLSFSSSYPYFYRYIDTLQSAVAKAYEICAPYTQCQISIYVFSFLGSSHYMLRAPDVSNHEFSMTQVDTTSQNMVMTIAGLTCFEGFETVSSSRFCFNPLFQPKPTIRYKMRDTYQFKVNGGLTIRQLKIDAIDSLITPKKDKPAISDKCLYNNVDCCFLNMNNPSPLSSPDNYACAPPITVNEECVYFKGKPFIDFNFNDYSTVSTPPTLTITDCIFSNFLYEYDSFINLNKYGGFIVITGSTFEYFSSCGSFIRNTQRKYYNPQLVIGGAGNQKADYEMAYKNKVNQAQYTQFTTLNPQTVTDPYGCVVSGTLCYSLTITTSTFNYFNIYFATEATQNYATFVDPNFGLQYYGMILSLNGFAGNIILDQNIFSNNNLKYYSCDSVGVEMANNNSPSKDSYPNYGTKNRLQIKDTGSAFYPAIFLKNTFEYNGAFIEGGALYIRGRAKSGVSLSTPLQSVGEANYQCGGYLFEENIFRYTIGCPKLAGATLYFMCVQATDTPSSPTRDTYTISADLSASMQTGFLGVGNVFSDATYAQTYTYTPTGLSYTFYTSKTYFKNNVYDSNLASKGYGILHLQNLYRVEFDGDKFDRNGDSFCQALKSMYNVKIKYFNNYICSQCTRIDLKSVLQGTQSLSSEDTAKSVIYIRNAYYLSMINVDFTATQMIEYLSFDTKKAQVLYLYNFFGNYYSNTVNIKDHIGLVNSYYLVEMNDGSVNYLALNTEVQTQQRNLGGQYPLFKFEKSQFNFEAHFLNVENAKFNYFNAQPPDRAYIFDFGYSTSYTAPSFHLQSSTFKDIECYNCAQNYPLMNFNCQTLLITGTPVNPTKFENINVDALAKGKNSKASIMHVNIRKPYSLSTITEMFTLQYIQCNNAKTEANGNFMKAFQQTIAGSSAPAINLYQLLVQLSTFSNMQTTGQGGVFYLDLSDINPKVQTTSFTAINADQTGGVFQINKLRYLTLSSIIASSFTSGGEGSFIHNTDNTFPFDITLDTSSFTCKPLGTFTLIADNTVDYFSVFYLRKTSQPITITTTANSFSKCFKAQDGGIFNLDPGSSNVIFTDTSSTYQQISVGGLGGVFYGKNCFELGFSLTTYNQISSFSDGGVFYAKITDTSFTMQDIVVTNTRSERDGGFAFLEQLSGAIQTQFTLLGTTSTSCYIDGSVAQRHGGAFFLKMADAQFTSSQASIKNTQALTGNGGFLNHGVNQVQSQIIFSQTVVDTSTAVEGGLLYLDSGIIYVDMNTGSTISNVLASQNGGILKTKGADVQIFLNTIDMNGIQALLQGGAFYLWATGNSPGTAALSMTNVNVNGCKAGVTGGAADPNISGGLAYVLGETSAQVTISGCLNVNDVTSQGYGGVIQVDKATPTFQLDVTGSTFNEMSSRLNGGLINVEGDITDHVSAIINIDTSTFICKPERIWNFAFSDVYNKLNTNVFDAGTLIFLAVETVATVNSNLNQFKQCYTAEKGGIFFMPPGTTINEMSSTFTDIGALKGSVLYCQSCTANLYSSDLKDVLARDGGSLYLLDAVTVLLDGVQLFNGKAIGGNGGAISATHSGTPVAGTLTFQNCGAMSLFESTTGNGGFFFIENPLFQLGSSGCSWADLYASQKGGLIYGGQLSNFNLDSCGLQNITSGLEGSFFYSESPTIAFSISTCVISCKPTTQTVAAVDAQLALGVGDIGVAFYFNGAISVSSTSNTFQNCYVTDKGSIFALYNTQLVELNSIYHHNSAIQGGAIYCENCEASITGAIFHDQYAKEGAIIYGNELAKITMINIQVSNSRANYGTLAYLTETTAPAGVFFTLQNSPLVSGTKALFDGGLIWAHHTNMDILIDTVTATTFEAVNEGGLIYTDLLNSLTIQSSTFTTFKAGIAGSFIKSTAPDITIQLTSNVLNCEAVTFSTVYNIHKSKLENIPKIRGSTIEVVDANNVVNVLSMTVNKCYYADRGGVYSMINSELIDQSGTYTYISAAKGGVYYCKACPAITVTSGSYSNIKSLEGSLFYILRNEVAGETYTTATTTFTFTTVTITNAEAYFQGGLGKIINDKYTTDPTHLLTPWAPQIDFDQITVGNSWAYQKGGLFMIDNSLTVMNVLGGYFSNFGTKDADSSGGGFHLEDAQQLVINKNAIRITTFFNFKAVAKGSLIFSPDSSIDIQILESNVRCKNAWTNYLTQLYPYTEYISMTGNMASAIELSGTGVGSRTINSLLIKYYNCYSVPEGAVFNLGQGTQLTDDQSQYIGNAAYYGGVALCNGCSMIITNGLFQKNVARYGGSFFLQYGPTIDLQNSIVTNSSAIEEGGFMFAYEQALGTQYGTVTLRGVQFQTLLAGKNGGLMLINSKYISLITFDVNVVFDSSALEFNGGGIYLSNIYAGDFILTQTTVKNVFAKVEGSFFYSASPGMTLTLSNNNLDCRNTFDSTIVNTAKTTSSFQTMDWAGAFYISGASLVEASFNQFQRCYIANYGAIYFFKQVGLYTDTNSVYKEGVAKQGGAIYCDTCNMEIKQIIFDKVQAKSGGTIVLDNKSNMIASQLSIQNSFSISQGGAIAIFQSDISGTGFINIVTIKYCETLLNIRSDELGGMIYMSNSLTQLYLSQMAIDHMYANRSGGVFYIEKANHIEINELNVFEIGAQYGSIVYSVAPDFTFNISYCDFACFSNYQPRDVSNSIDIYKPDEMDVLTPPNWVNFQSVFYIQGAKLVKSDNNRFTNCFVAKDGGVFSLVQSSFMDLGSQFSRNAALNGGAINCNECKMDLMGTIFENNYAYTGGIIFMQKDGYLHAKLVKFKNNQAFKEGGGIYVTQQSYFNLENCQFISNKAYQSSAIEIFGGSIFFNSSCTQTLFSDNIATNSFTLKMDQGTLVLDGVTFKNNNAGRRAKNVFTVFSKIYIFKSRFINSYYTLQYQGDNINNFLGGFIFLGVNSYGTLWLSTFENGEAYNGGAIYVSSEALLKVNQTTFIGNYAKKSGGAIYSQASFDVIINQQSKFINNVGLEQGDHVFFAESLDYSLQIYDTSFSTASARSSAVYVLNSRQVLVERCSFYDIIRFDRRSSIGFQYGGALNCQRCLNLKVLKSTFTNIKSANYGGAIYVKMQDQYKLEGKIIPEDPTFLVDGCTFVGNEAEHGGAIYNNNGDHFVINDSTFINNTAVYSNLIEEAGTAGVIYYYCTITQQQCLLNLTGENSFIGNQADLQGGAIHWQVMEVKFNETLTTFQNNSALIYGDDISCVPQRIVYLDPIEFESNREKRIKAEQKWISEGRGLTVTGITFQETAVAQSQRSGADIPETYLGVVDMFGRIVGSNQESKLWVSIDESYKSSDRKVKFPPVLEGTQTFFSQNGTFNISGMQFTGAPGENYTLIFESDAIDFKVPSNEAYKNKMKELYGRQSIQFDLTVDFRQCVSGESFTSAGKCTPCPSGDYFSIVPMTEPGDCQKCPTEQAICLGGDRIGPRPGYWRSSNVTDKFIECFNKDACLGFIAPNWDPKGECAELYQGYLCSDCIFGSSKTSATSFKCAICPPLVSNAVKLSATMILYIGVLVFLVRSTLQSAKQKKSVTSIYMKIFLNHLQLIGIVQSFNFSFPETVTKYFGSVSSAGDQAGTQILSLDCYLDTRKSPTDELDMNIYFEKMIIITLLPFLIFFGVLIVWNILKTIYEKNRRKTLGQEWRLKIEQADQVILHGDEHEKAVAVVKKRELLEEGTYRIGGKMISSIIILLFFVHPTIVQYSISDFNCVDIDGETRLKPDLNVECWVGEHMFFTLAVALPCLVVWGLGIPFFALVMLMRYKDSLTKIETKEMFGFLYNGYKRENYFWEIIIMYRKIIVIFISVFLQPQGVICQAMVVFAILILFLTLNLKVRPFGIDDLNDLETLSVVTQIITIYCGIFFITDVSDTLANSESLTTATLDAIKSSGVVLSEFFKTVLFIIIVLANFAFFLIWGVKLFSELKAMFINKMPKIYVLICLCNDYEKFKELDRKQKIKEANDELKEEYERTLKKLLGLQESGKLILSQNMMERINVYLDEDRFLTSIGYRTERMTDKQYNRVMRQKNILEAKNQFMSAAVVPINGDEEEVDGFYKNMDGKDMIRIDGAFMKGRKKAFKDDSISSGVEDTKAQMIDEKNIWSDENGAQLDFSSSLDSASLNEDIKVKRDKKRPQWEIDYLRRRRGSLNDQEVEDQLWQDEKGLVDPQEAVRKQKELELKLKKKQDEKLKHVNNFFIPNEFEGNENENSERNKNKVHKVNLKEQIEKTKDLSGVVGKKNYSYKEKIKIKQRKAREAKKKEVKRIRPQNGDNGEETGGVESPDHLIKGDAILDDLERNLNMSSSEEGSASLKRKSIKKTQVQEITEEDSFRTDDEEFEDEEDLKFRSQPSQSEVSSNVNNEVEKKISMISKTEINNFMKSEEKDKTNGNQYKDDVISLEEFKDDQEY